MNKHLHRIVFNAARGMRMVVQETATSTGKGASRATGKSAPAAAALLFGVLVALPGQAQIVASPMVAGSLRPTVLVAPNGVPLVNIQTPSAAGISRNVYSQFDVMRNGVILNNSRVNAQSQLGGWVQGNPWLAGGPARVILNEINGGNPSQLRGQIEVAGQRAEVVIANPAGILVDGSGFINASRATLTTGLPQLDAFGGLDNFVVRSGTVHIEGAGLDLSRTDYAAILARAVQVNAGIWANELKVVTGANQISADHVGITPTAGTGSTPNFALDVAALGGMYARKITLIGTEAGLGVRNAGSIGAGAGGLVVTAQGRLENTGTLEGSHIELASSADIGNRGGTIRQTGMSGLTIDSRTLSNTSGGVIGAEPVAPAGAAGSDGSSASVGAAAAGAGTSAPSENGSVGDAPPVASYVAPAPGSITAAGAINNDGGRIYAGAPIVLKTPQIDNAGGRLNVATMAVTGANFSNAGGTLNVSQSFGATVGQFDNTGGKLNAGTLDIATSGDLINIDGTLASGGDASLAVGGKASNTRGTISSTGALTASVTGATANNAGTLASNQGLLLKTGSLDNTKGSIQSAQAGVQLAVAGQLINGNGGSLGAATDLNVQAGSLVNSGSLRGANDVGIAVDGALTNDGSITAARNTTVTAGSLQSSSTGVLGAGVQNDGKLGASGDLRVATSGALVANGNNIAAGNATLQGASVDLSGSQTSAANIAATATQGNVTTSKATVVTPGTLSVTADAQPGQTLVNAGGKLNANQLDLKVSNLANTQGGEIVQTGAGVAHIATSGAIDNGGGTLASNGSLALTAASLNNKGGTLRAAQTSDLTVTAAGLVDNRQGEMSAGGSTTLQAGSLDNDAGRIAAARDASSTTSGATSNQGGTIAANGNTTLHAGSLNNAGGSVSALNTLTANVQGAVDNTAGTLVANQALVLDAGSLVNDKGTVQSAQAATRLNVGGALTNGTGYIGAATDLNIKAGSLANAGTLRGANDITVAVGDALSNGGSITAGRNTTVTAGSVQGSSTGVLGAGIQSDGKLAAVGDLSVHADGALSAHGTTLAAGNATLQGASVDVSSSQTSAANIAITATQGDVVTSKATVVTPGTLSVTANSNAAQTLVNDAGKLNAKQLDLKVSNLANTNGGEIVQTGKGAMRIQTSGAIDNSGGVLASNGDLTFVAASLDNKAGTLRTGEGANLSIDVNGLLRNSDRGEMASGGNATVRAGTLDNETGRLTAAGDVSSTTAAATGNHGGTIAANGSVVLDAGSLDNSAGAVSSHGTLTANIRGAADNAGGTLVANQALALAAASLDNDKGSIQSVQAAAKFDVTDALTNAQGYIGAATDLGLRAGSLANTGNLRGANDTTVDVKGHLANDGSITSGRHTTIAADSVQGGEKSVFGAGIQGDGKTAAVGDLSVKTHGALVAQGTNLAAGHAALQGASIDLSKSQAGAASIALAAGQGDVVTRHATIVTPGTLAITADADPSQTLVNEAGKLDAGRLELKVSNLTNAGGGEIVQTGTDATAIAMRGTLDNEGGRIASNGNLALAAATLRNRDGTVHTAATADLALTVKGLADNAGGDIASGSDLSIHAGTLGNDAGRITAAGSASGTVDGAAGNKGGTIASNGATSLGGGSLDNSAGTVSGAERVAVDIAGALNNTEGTVVSHGALSLKAGSLDNAAGVVRSIQSTAQLEVAGALANSKGQVDAATDLDVKAGSVANTGSLRGTHDTAMNVRGQLINDGNITAGRHTTVTAGSVKAGGAGVFGAGIQLDGTLGDAGTLSMRTGGALVAQGRNLAAGDAALQGTSVDVSGSQTSAANIAVTATQGDVTTSKAAVVTPGTLAVAANSQPAQALVNAGGQVNANRLDLKLSNLANTNGGEIVQVGTEATTIAVAGTLNNDGGRIASNGRDLRLGAGGAMTNAAGRIEHAPSEGQGTLTLKAGRFSGAGGQITGNGAFVADVAGAFEQDAATTRARSIAIDAGSLGNRGGQIVQSGADAARIAIVGAIDNSGGTIASNGHLNVAAGSLANHGGAVRAAGASSLDLAVTGALDNSSNGVIGAGGNGTIAAGRLNNDTGSVTAAGDLRATVGGAATNVGGMLAANGNTTLVAGTLDNSKGTAAAVKGDLSVTTTGATTNDAGTLQAAARIALKNGGFGNIGGKALGDSLSVDTHGHALDNTQGTLAAATTVALNAGALVNAAGLIQSGGAMTIDTNGKALTNTHAAGYASKQGGIASADTLDLKTGSIDNAAGFIGAKKALTASTQAQAFSNTKAGLVLGQSTVAIDTHDAAYDNSGGQTMAAGDLRIGAGSLGNTAGLIRSMATTTLDAGSIDNHGTQGKDQGIEGQRVAIAASGLNNASGAIRADADATVTSGGTVDNTGGLISGGGTVAIADPRAGDPASKTLNLVNTNGALVGDQHLKIDAATFSGAGQLIAGKDLSIALKQDIVNNAGLSAHGNLAYTTTGSFTNRGKLVAGQALTVGGREVDNTAGAEMSGTDTTVNAGDTLTNRGLIDSNGNTRIDAGAVKNIGTGRIYGNQVSIATGTLDNDAEGVDGATKAGTIAARNTLNIGANAIHNREHALLLSAGAGADAMRIGATLDANRLATGQGGVLDNLSADIESLGGLSVSMADVNNRDVHIERGEPDSEGHMLVTYTPKMPVMGHSGFYLPEQVRLDPDNGQVFLKKPDGTEELVGMGGYAQWTSGVVTTRETARNIDPARMAAAGDITVSGRLLNQDSQVTAGGTVQAGPYAPEQMQGERTTTVGPTIVINEKGGFEPMVLAQTKKDTVSLGAYKYEPNVNAASGTKPDAAAAVGGNGAASADGIGSVTTGHGAATIVEVPANVGAVVSVPGESAGNAGAAAAPRGVAAVAASASGVVHVDGAANAQSSSGVDRVAVMQHGNAGVGTVTAGAAVHAEAAPGGVPAPRAGQANATHIAAGAPIAAVPATVRAGATRTIPMVVRTSSPNTSIPRASLFNIHPEAGSRYVVETDPRFANYREWLGSDYLLNNLGLDPNNTLKRLGDGFYEQKLIREQVAQLTGYRFLEGFASDDDQYTALMNAGATFAKQYGLRPGIALSAAQMAQLTSDIVWLVEQTVTLPDGSTQQALAPQVYVRVRPGDIDGSGALLSADATVIKSKGDVVNTGTIAGRTLVAINAENVKNLGGRIAGGSVGLNARNDLENIGGSITARDSAVLTAGRDIRIETASQSAGTTTAIDRVAGLYVTNPGGALIVSAGRDANLIGAALVSAGTAAVGAGRNINMGTVTEGYTIAFANKNAAAISSESREVGSVIQGQDNVRLAAGNDLNIRAGAIASMDGAVVASAKNDINVTAGQSTTSVSSATQKSSKKLFKRSSSSTFDSTSTTDVLSSSLSGKSVALVAGNDINLQAAQLRSDEAMSLSAGRDINLTTANRTTQEMHAAQSRSSGTALGKAVAAATFAADATAIAIASNKKSSNHADASIETQAIGTGISAGSLQTVSGRDTTVQGATVVADKDIAMLAGRNLTIESAQNTRTESSYDANGKSGMVGKWFNPAIGNIKGSQANATADTTQQASQVASLQGDVTLVAGNEYRQTASSVLAAGQAGPLAGGDVNILAKNVVINEAHNTAQSVSMDKSSSTIVGGSASFMGVSTDTLKGASSTIKAMGETTDGRAQALGAINLAMSGKEVYDTASNLASGGGLSYGVSVNIGRNTSQGTSFTNSKEAVGSGIVGASNVNIVAAGGDKASNIRATGSTIAAGNTVNLAADNDVTLEASKNTSLTVGQNSSRGANVGVTFGAGAQNGFSIQLGVNKGKGRNEQNDVSYNASQVSGGKAVNVTTGGDLNMRGGIVEANRVTADVGGNLNIESLQDVSVGQSRQSSGGFGLSLCIPPICYGIVATVSASAAGAKADGIFVSPAVQSGIKVGDEGFDVKVAGNTDLKGAVIESTQAAIDNKKNSFSTGGALTMTDLQNVSESSGSSYSVSGSVGIGFTTAPKAATETAPAKEMTSAWSEPNNRPSGGAGVGSFSGNNQTSVTKSGISGIAGDQSVRTGDNSSAGTLVKDWNTQTIVKDVQAQAQITQEFGQNASKAVGDYANGKLKEANDLYDQAAAEADPGKKAALYAQADQLEDNWKEGGAYRVAAHAAVGGLTGGAGGAAGAAASSIAIPAIGEQIANLDIPVPVKQALVMAMGAAIGATAGGTAGVAGGFNEASNNYLTATDLRSRQQKLEDCRARKNPACEVDILRAYDLKNAKNTGELKGSSLIEKMGLENVRAGLEQLLLDPEVNVETKAQARRSLKEVNAAINVIDKAPVLKDAAEVSLLAIDIATLWGFAVARVLSTSIVKEFVLSRTGKAISDDAAERIAGNFYADSGAVAKNPLLVDSIPRNGNRLVLDQGMILLIAAEK
jgi:filamentous hemagglutinin